MVVKAEWVYAGGVSAIGPGVSGVIPGLKMFNPVPSRAEVAELQPLPGLVFFSTSNPWWRFADPVRGLNAVGVVSWRR